MTDEQIVEAANEWSKSPGFMEFERNDFIRCVRALLSASKPAGSEYTYETYTGQCGWLVVSKEEYEQSEYRKRRTPIAASPQPVAQTADSEPEHSAIYISKRLTGSDKDASFVQAHINQAVSEAMERAAPQPAQTAVVLDDEREAFETWCLATERDLYVERLGLGYFHPVTSVLWDCWRASAASPATAPQSGESYEEYVCGKCWPHKCSCFIAADTGNTEADKIIGRLMSNDPDFEDCTSAAVFIRKLIADLKGPDGFATWKDAALDERMKRVSAAGRVDLKPSSTGDQKVGS
jgi:hypothetical protein